MKFDTAAGSNPLDRMRVIGQPVDRIDGALKTTGRARYAYERHDVAPDAAYGWVVGATIAKGRVVGFDTGAAEAAPGVLAILKATDRKALPNGPMNAATLFGGDEVQHYHQAVALVIAETFEAARSAAALVHVDYAAQDGAYDLDAVIDAAPIADETGAESKFGEFDAAFAAAPVTLDATYTTPVESHAMMEPHATLARWDGDALTVWTSNQMIAWAKRDLAKALGIKPDKVRVQSPFIGGGFGSKLFLRADVVLAALGAQAVGRPVKVALHRPLIANNTTHRAGTVQRIRLAAERDGRLTAISHESWSGNLDGGSVENAISQTQLLYAGANRYTAAHLAHLDLPEANAMRAPGEAPGLMALEIAMDEMAERLGMDPVAFRIANDTQVDPEHPDKPYSVRQLTRCFEVGAERFGWSRRGAPGAVRDGRWLVGMGVATGFRNHLVQTSGARVRLGGDGRVTVETDMTDIGTGSYTIIAQTAAEMMGVPLGEVVVSLGDSSFPASAGSGGQWGANSATAGVYAACVQLREEVARRLGFNSADAQFVDGEVRAGNRSAPLARAAADGELVAEDKIEFGKLAKTNQLSTFAAHFVELGVDDMTAEVRVRRMLAVCAAGRILNPKTARSQVIGAMTMGVGAALMEELAVDTRRGFFVNHDLATYEVPVHADIPHQEVVFLDEADALSSPMKAKGVGELGLCGVGAAIANAIANATGVRVRDYPMTLDKIIAELPAAA